MSVDFALPESWINIKLGNILAFQNGYAFKSSNYVNTGSFVIRIGNVQDGYISLHNPAYIDGNDLSAQAFKLNADDILVSLTGNVGRIAIVKESHLPAVLNQRVARLLLSKEMNQSFIFHLMRSNIVQSSALKLAKGAAQLNISTKDLAGIMVSIPSKAEQQVIAERLDTLLARVESIKARLESIPEILKQFRQSVLAAAVSGKLTEEWRGNSDTRDIEEYSKWDWGGVPTNWDVDIYSHLVESRLGKMLDKQKNEGKPTKYLGNINVRWASFDLENIQEILVSEKEQIELAVQVGDVLICEGGEPGRCAIWKSDYNEPIIFQKALHRARVSDRLLPEWLVFNLKNDADRNTLDQLFTGTTIKHLTGAALKSYPLRVPPINEQKEILNRVNSLFFKADVFEDQVKSALDRVNNLAQSILAKAFRGELTAEWREANPELISGENSAEALLERIKAERSAKAVTKRGRGKA